MKINRLIVNSYRNLTDIDITFPNSNMIAFIGNNGSGKSNLLELIAQVFAYAKNCLTKGKNYPLAEELEKCEIDYIYNGEQYALKFDSGSILFVHNLAEIVKKSKIENILPKSIFLYYSGETKRLAEIESRTIDEKYGNALKSNKFNGYKFIEYFSVNDLDILLLTAAVYQGKLADIVAKYTNGLRFYQLFSLIIANPKKSSVPGGEYFGAVGFVKAFLDEMRRYVSRTEEIDNYLNQKRKAYAMHFDEIDELKNVADGPSDFFAKMKALKNSGYLEKVFVSFRNDNQLVIWNYLSEGEKQILLMKLLTEITSMDDCLYLFDEFDSFLHLNWQRSFSSMFAGLDTNGQVLFTTHSPATISGMKRESVFIMEKGGIRPAPSETFNRSLDEIMEEQMLVTMRPKVFTDLEREFRNAVVHNRKDVALAKLEQIREIVGDDDPFFITASMALRRME